MDTLTSCESFGSPLSLADPRPLPPPPPPPPPPRPRLLSPPPCFGCCLRSFFSCRRCCRSWAIAASVVDILDGIYGFQAQKTPAQCLRAAEGTGTRPVSRNSLTTTGKSRTRARSSARGPVLERLVRKGKTSADHDGFGELHNLDVTRRPLSCPVPRLSRLTPFFQSISFP